MKEDTTAETVIHNIKYRRSIFPASYSDQEISKDTLITLLECANDAPTHKRTEPWRFTVFRKQGLVRLAEKLAEIYKDSVDNELFVQKKYDVTYEKVTQSSAVLAIVVNYSGKVPEWEELAAVSCAVQNIWLAAAAKGIGSYWSSPSSATQLSEFLNLKENQQCLGLFYMGYHSEAERESVRTPISEKITWIEG
ncbi:nitroreductase family protein [Olivibacter sitiensis]|uniref:nitroreductase family protein n=1 Tax=Olivibacter sitiensis TaxID=376470 RepID=UPI0003F88426|nr:nitroreductase [Olivibacter sitiensis]